VYVDHDFDIISAEDIANTLDSEGFNSVVKQNAAIANQMIGIPSDVFVKSTFDLTDVFQSTADAVRGTIREDVLACLEKKRKENQVTNVFLDLQVNILSLEHNPYYVTAASLANILSRKLHGVQIASDGGADGTWALPSIKDNTEEFVEPQSSNVRWPVVLSGIFWIISMLSFIGGSWEYLKYVALLSVAFGLPSIAGKAFRTLRRRHFDVNCMMLFAAIGALPLQEYTESAAVTFLFAISETLEQRATARARGALSAIVRLRPEYANVVNPITNDVVILPANSVAVGTTVSVRPGDKIPCDGVVTEGKSTVDEATLTGESRPVIKSIGMRVSGGTINNGNTQLVIKTTATSNNSAVARLIRLIEEAQTYRSETEKVGLMISIYHDSFNCSYLFHSNFCRLSILLQRFTLLS
jgi:Cd2+/Zn2+-exporting ATPase